MRRIGWVVTVALLCAWSIGVATQQAPAPAAPAVFGADLPWAFPLKVEKPLPDSKDQQSLQGSTKKYTFEQVNDLLNPPDWFPDQHPAAPQIVLKGHMGAMACGACHLMSGLGHPESSDLTGLNPGYIVQQLIDFKAGTRIDPTRMNGIAKELSMDEMMQAAEYFAKLAPKPNTKVMEATMVPKTFLGDGRMRYVDTAGGMEALGNRIIEVPEFPDRARLRDPNTTFIAYAPVGSLAKGKVLVETGGGKSVACTLCHGMTLHGQGGNPRLAGLHPIYTVRQLHWFKRGTRKGTDAPLMQLPVAQLTDEDIINISAYLASLAPGEPPK
jgi:cytochrome c553